MNKQEMISEISTKVGGTKKDAGIYPDAVVETITEALAKHEKIALVGFGTFEARHRDARIARNPQDGTVKFRFQRCMFLALRQAKH
ncbi:HU family DNA-binding protein [Eubacterium ramulus]|uniref:HU family DNA-binding protein n=1 Tax=Eubacterium ramulus TaxID=39490 RepID=UPI00399A59B2